MTAPVVVFVGPTLPLDDARAALGAEHATYLGPAAQGSVLRALEAGPAAIAIIDGAFAQEPAVWHKELLWALSEGVHVLGASSMGALRAAELAPFGMVGVGAIFEGFRAGTYEDDDEVTIAHAGADAGYRPLSDAMVDLRATFARALSAGVIDAPVAAALVARAKALHYTERTYAAVLAAVEAAAPDAAGALARLRAWLPAHKVSQKRDDALALLSLLRTMLEAGPLSPFEPRFRFEHTDAWEQLARRSAPRRTGLDPRTAAPLLDELRLAPGGAYRAALDGALARTLAAAEARRQELIVDEALLGEAANAFFLHRGTLSPEAIQAWMAAERLDAEALTRFLHREAAVHWARTLYATEALDRLPDQLRAAGALLPLHRRAQAKQRLLSQLGGVAAIPIEPAEGEALLAWFFSRRGQPSPGSADVCAQVLGFESGERLLRALALERRFVESDGAR